MIEFAQWNMRRQLSVLWQEAFGDTKRIPDFFLNNIFSPRDCLVFLIGGEIASAVYLLPSFIVSDGKKVPSHYIFAASTARKYRSRGYMSALLAYASIVGAERGDHFSAVLPSSENLYEFYASAGYSDFYEVCETEIDQASLRRIAGPCKSRGRVLPDILALNRLRKNCLMQHGGSLLWDDRMFCLSSAMSAVYGDKLICASGKSGPAYALCRVESSSECTVLESFAADGVFPRLAAAVIRYAPAEKYCFRFPVNTSYFTEQGVPRKFGMLKPLGGRTLTELAPNAPYLGLAMD